MTREELAELAQKALGAGRDTLALRHLRRLQRLLGHWPTGHETAVLLAALDELREAMWRLGSGPEPPWPAHGGGRVSGRCGGSLARVMDRTAETVRCPGCARAVTVRDAGGVRVIEKHSHGSAAALGSGQPGEELPVCSGSTQMLLPTAEPPFFCPVCGLKVGERELNGARTLAEHRALPQALAVGGERRGRQPEG